VRADFGRAGVDRLHAQRGVEGLETLRSQVSIDLLFFVRLAVKHIPRGCAHRVPPARQIWVLADDSMIRQFLGKETLSSARPHLAVKLCYAACCFPTNRLSATG